MFRLGCFEFVGRRLGIDDVIRRVCANEALCLHSEDSETVKTRFFRPVPIIGTVGTSVELFVIRSRVRVFNVKNILKENL